MQSEQQQRIMGYFIEEAKDHLNTIEQGLLSLQSTMEDREMLNEVFRAAHSVKGGAAMLGISSIQKTAHRLEDCIKVLQESPVKVDAQLESLFLRVFDTLQALIEQLQSPFGLTDDAANEIMSDAEPVLEELNTYLEKLVEKAERSAVATAQAPEVALANSQVNTGSSKTLPASFKRDVLVELREMLQLFKQQDSPEHREALQEHCRQVARVGEELDLPGWSELLESARAAIAYPANSYRQLANLVIKEIKQAEELALAGRSVEIAPSEQLKALVPEPPVSSVSEAADALEPEFDLTFDDDFDSEAREFETVAGDGYLLQDESESPLINLFDSPDTEVQEDFQDEWNEQDFILDNTEDIYPHQTPIQVEGRASAASRFADSAAGATPGTSSATVATPGSNLSEPEVGMAELNTLADIFEGQTPDLDQTWQEEEIISLDDRALASDSEELFSLDDQNDFSDLVGDLDGLDIEAGSASLATPEASASTSDDDLIDWLGDESTDSATIALPGASESAVYSQEQTGSQWSALESEAPLDLTSNVTDDFADLVFEDDSSDPLLDSSTPPEELSSLFGDSFFEEDSPLEQNLEEFGFDADATEQVQQQEDEVFAMPVTDVFEEAPLDFSTSTDTSMEGEDFFNESFTSSGSDFLAFEDSPQEREDTDSDESWLEVSASAPHTQDALAESEMDFSDLLEISDSVSAAAPDSEAIALPGASSAAVAMPGVSAAEDLGFGEELGIGDQATDLHFEELVFDESAADFDFAANENLTGGEWEDSSADLRFEELEFDESVADFDFAANENLTGDEWEDSSAAESPQVSEPSALSLEGNFLDTSTQDISDIESLTDLNFDLDATSTSPFNFDAQTSGDMDDLFENEALSPSEPSHSAVFESLEGFDDVLDTPTASAPALEELDFSDGASEPSHSAAFESLEGFDDVLDTPTASAPVLEELDFSAFEEPETIPDFDTLNAFFDTEEAIESDAFGVATTAETADDIQLEFEEFSIFEMPGAIDDFESQGIASPQASALDEEALDEQLFEPSATGAEGVANFSDSLLDTDEGVLFDVGAEEASQSADSAALENPPASDLEALFGDEIPGETDSEAVATPEAFDLDLSSFAADDLNFDGDLFASDAALAELEFAPEEAATVDAQTPIFEWQEDEISQAAAGSAALESPPASDLEALFGDEISGETDSAAVPTPEAFDFDFSSFAADDLNFDGDLFASDAALAELEFAPEEAATVDAQTPIFEWQEDEISQAAAGNAALESPPASDLEALFGDEIPGETDSAASVLPEALAFDSFEENLFEASPREQELADEEATANFLNLDWEGADAIEAENFEDFLSAEPEAPSVADATLPEVEDVGAAEDETAAALDFDWETQESDSLTDSYSYPSGERYPSGSPLEYANTSDLFPDVAEEVAASSPQAYEFDDLEAMLADGTATARPGASSIAASSPQIDEFADLEAMLDVASIATDGSEAADTELSFNDLEALLSEQMPATAEPSPVAATRAAPKAKTEDEFSDLESLLEQAEKTMGGPPSVRADQPSARPAIRPRSRIIEQTMRVPVKHLDSLSNLVGELVVNRNTLEQDQERLRQFLDNLSHQVLALSDVGSRMQDLYERSLLESSLLASRHGYRSSAHSDRSSHNQHFSGVEYDPLEMDRFTGFHLLSQEMIELIVRVRESASDIEFLVDETDQVARMLRQITTQLQEGLTRSRMVPFAQNADRLRRAVHEVCRKLGKEAKLIVEGGETLIDKMILEHLYDPMTHLVNNALTHGIERPEVRKAARKPAAGQIVLRAFHQGNQTVISISDDGAGINPETVRSKAVEKKLYTRTEAKNLTNAQLYDCLFHAGFSTKDKADDFAGRGVGMDVVRTSLSEIRGSIHIDSSVGKGTTFTIRLPLTLSICKALCCLNDKASIAFPMDGVEDMLDVPSDRVQTNSEGKTCIQWRDTQLCFQPLSELLNYKRQISRSTVYGGKREDDTISIVVLRSAGNFLAIQVDRVLGEQEIVIKQLEGPPPKPVGIAGATVLGDGRIMAIADVMELIDLSRGIRPDAGVTIWHREETQVEVPQETPPTKSEPMVLIVDDSITVRELLSMTFSKSGYRVEQARDGQEAWDKLRSGLPCDIVFCDIEMPRMDGLELLSRLQKDENLCHLPIAMLTSRGADRHRQMASQLGASGYFTKPYLEEVLLDAAQRMIKGEVLFSSSNA